MTTALPINAEPVAVEWLTREGGIRIVAWTNDESIPFLGVFTLNRMGQPNGLPCWLRRSRFLSDVVIGFNDEKPVIIRLFVHVRPWGLEVTLDLSRYATTSFRYRRKLFASWEDGPRPSFGFQASNEPPSFSPGFFDGYFPENDP
jgi:hypothetical protein